MGDVPPTSSSPGDYPSQENLINSFHGPPPGDDTVSFTHPANNLVFQPQYQQRQFDSVHNAVYPAQYDMNQAQGTGRAGPYNMTAMANALPQPGFRPPFNLPGQQQRYVGDPQQMSSVAPYTGHNNMNTMAAQQYYIPQHPTMLQYYNNQVPHSHQQANLSPTHNMQFYPNQVMMNQAQQQQHLSGYYYPQPNQYPGQGAAVQRQMMPNQFGSADLRGSSPAAANEQYGGASSHGQSEESLVNQSNIVRGPPRKPRQSGHAIWIGNLPPQTNLMNLVHHVCKEAPGLESLFLISKSNCAFANFKDEEACQTAQQKLHDSKFQSVRLVSRLRKNTVEGVAGQTAPTGPAAISPSVQQAPPDVVASPVAATPPQLLSPSSVENPTETKNAPVADGTAQKDKFFILKSLTVEDLDLSVRSGVWATQSHNEESLNNAFKSADNVYLVFSANKSGEYFGYARMTSPINNDPAAAIEFAPKAQTTSDLDLPKAIPTEATEHCPRGNVIDDSARGTIFWEIEREEGDVVEEESDDSGSAQSGQDGEAGSKAWGKPFKLEWLSTTRLPFYRTRGLRNPWNSNREVKIARDGTQLEPSVGRRLVGLFNRVQSPAPMVAGYASGPPMRPVYPQ
ncbi:YT521-B-like domain-containing protein [Pseudomassariella vexata]|uniref:YT521-B-like domain-domain-containing protein n=1 Tax=Pseudomassariella vexata TaxID=1141098 RepID=A0A1Y2E3F6_9PEZI|nr:YT521-B-like domain-containing protein [Pseudomassariella vexata]ORY66039.1 YT521-B-like domain-domain-containing protein [Pseudomassariella vexata]